MLILVAVALMLAAFSLGRVAPQAAMEAPVTPELQTTVVQPGDTLWSIARRVAPRSDPRVTVEQLRRLNEVPRAGLVAGQSLMLPE